MPMQKLRISGLADDVLFFVLDGLSDSAVVRCRVYGIRLQGLDLLGFES